MRTNELVAMLIPKMAPVSLEVTDFVSDDVTTTFIVAIANTTKGTKKYICRQEMKILKNRPKEKGPLNSPHLGN